MAEQRKARRQRGEGSVYRRASDGLWVGMVDVGRVDGKRRRKTVYGKTQAAVVKKIRTARREIEAGNLRTSTVTVEKWVEHWLDDIAPASLKPRVLATKRSECRQHIIPTLGNVRLDRLTQAHVRELHKSIIAKGRSSSTALNVHRTLNKILNDAMREDLLTRNVAALTKKPTAAESTRGSLTLDEVAALLRHLDGDRMQSRFAFALFTGARQGECLGLQWSRLDLDNGVADLEWQLQRIPYRHGCGEKRQSAWPCGRRADHCPSRELGVQPGYTYRQLEGNLCLQRPKTEGSKRVIPLPPTLLVALRERRAQYDDERHAYVVDHDLVWAREDGRPIEGRQDWADWIRHLDAVDIERQALHVARHTTSTLLLALGVSEHERMAILGHSEAATNRAYTHVDLALQRKALDQLDSAVQRVLER